MKIYPEEIKAYTLYLNDHPHLPALNSQQLKSLSEKAQAYQTWTTKHHFFHNSLNLILLTSLFILDILISTYFPIKFPSSYILLAFAHGFLIYSFSTFVLNEGVAHRNLFLGTNKFFNFLSFNITRFYFADPIYFTENHQRHHSTFATAEDGVFTSFVHPKRFFLSLMPLASAFKFCDFKIHTGETLTKSKILSEVLGRVFFIAQFLYLRHFVGGLNALLFVFIALWFAFILDRLREMTEHNLMGNKTANGARNLGMGFWGNLVGGGPWGQPCRLSHHLIPTATWYQQLFLHFQLKKMLTQEQKDFFLVKNFPLLLFRIIKINLIYIKKAA